MNKARNKRETSFLQFNQLSLLFKIDAVVIASLILIVFLACTVYYLVWRVAAVEWYYWWVSVPLLLVELTGIFNTLGLLYTIWPRSIPKIDAQKDFVSFPIYVMIPTVNEGTAVLEPTVRGALAARERYLEEYPHADVTVIVCNDGRVAGFRGWQDIENMASRLNISCITRTTPGGAKAGNIEYARQIVGATGEALIALFDADMVAEPDFLIKTLPPFADPTIGWVQTGQYYSNQKSVIARWAHDQQQIFYRVICVGKAAVNGAFICGTNVVIRAAALDSIGGLPQDSVTEDLAASILLHPNWRSLYLTDILAQGLGPEDLDSYFSQQKRWATGTFGVFFRHWREMLLPWHKNLSLPQRIQYLYCCGHFLSGFRDFVCLMAPLVYLFFGIAALKTRTHVSFMAHVFPYWIFSFFVFWYARRGKASFIAILHGIILGFGCFPIFIAAFCGVLLKKRFRFVVTPKRRQETSAWQLLSPLVLMLLLCLWGMSKFATPVHSGWLWLVSEAWTLYVVLLILGMMWLGVAANPTTEQRIISAGKRIRPVLLVMTAVFAGVSVSQQIVSVVRGGQDSSVVYTITDLGSLGGVNIFHGGGGINNAGQAVGSSQTFDAWEGYRAFLWADSEMQNLGAVPNSQFSVAYAINDHRQAVGCSNTGNGSQHAILWADGQIHDLGTLPGFQCSVATAINNNGQITGRVYNILPEGRDLLLWPSHAFLWENGIMRDLGTPAECTSSRAYAINDQGQIVGWAGTANGARRAFVWQAGRMTILASPSEISAATGINNSGEIVGEEGSSRDTMHAVVWVNGSIHDLGTILGHTFNKASAINSSGEVVGEARSLNENVPPPAWDPTGEKSMLGEATPPFIWDAEHGMRSLSSLIPSRSGWYLLQVFGINDQGQILAWGQYKNQERVCLLTPTSANKVQ